MQPIKRKKGWEWVNGKVEKLTRREEAAITSVNVNMDGILMGMQEIERRVSELNLIHGRMGVICS